MILLKYPTLIMILLLIGSGALAANFPQPTPATACQTLTCVRKSIDHIDAEIVKLIGLRLTYVKRAGRT